MGREGGGRDLNLGTPEPLRSPTSLFRAGPVVGWWWWSAARRLLKELGEDMKTEYSPGFTEASKQSVSVYMKELDDS